MAELLTSKGSVMNSCQWRAFSAFRQDGDFAIVKLGKSNTQFH